jgi:hypothetical protein
VKGVLCKVAGNFGWDLFFNRKYHGGPGPRRMDRVAWLGSTLDRGGADKRARQCLADMRRVGAKARRCSPATVEEDEAVPEGYSLEHEWR